MATVRHMGLFPKADIHRPDLAWGSGCINDYDKYHELYPTNDQGWSPWAEVSLENAVKSYWRVKTWKFESSATLIYPNVVGELPNQETEIVCKPLPSFQWLVNPFDETYQEENQIYQVGIGSPAPEYGGGRVAKSSSNQFYVYMLGAGFGTDDDPRMQRSHDGNLKFTFVYNGIKNDGSNTPYTVTSSISPETYWPYDPGDGGGPIYDSTTGAQLRPFPTN